mgnify:CR=1 FL=1
MKTSQMGHQKQLYIWMASKQEPFKLQKFMHISMTFGRTQAIFQLLQNLEKQQTGGLQVDWLNHKGRGWDHEKCTKTVGGEKE